MPAKTLYKADRTPQRTSFQSAADYSPAIDIRSDAAIVYGAHNLPERVAAWTRHGYIAHFMTGAAWGQYEPYIDGRFDGARHADEGQADAKGETIWHHPGVPYMVPTPSYVAYLKSLAHAAIDAGAEAIHFEEPEFWARAGYSNGFQKCWKTEYGEDWQRPDSSPDAFWRSAKLKYRLYQRALDEVFNDAKAYARSRNRQVRCFVPTHSLVNYSQWGIVSPESSLMDLASCDGYIAQVWTGTARCANTYRGTTAERTFETAFLEFASMHHMVAPTKRTVYFLADPIEDNPDRTWDDYRANYKRVLVASLLFPEASHFEVMPWPDRVLTAKYPAGSYGAGKPGERIAMPTEYAVELMTLVNMLNDMKQDSWETMGGSDNVGLLVSDTMMFQRDSPWSEPPDFGGLFGLAMPLVKHGIPVKTVVLEQIPGGDALAGVDVLLMSYEHMKPLRAEFNAALAKWVDKGGALVYFGDDKDRFHEVREWWNTGDQARANPREELFARMGIAATPADETPHAHGKGSVIYCRKSPRTLARAKTGANTVMRLVKTAAACRSAEVKTANYVAVRRGPYVTGAVLDESVSTEPLQLSGLYADLLTSGIPVVKNPVMQPGSVFLLRRLEPGEARGPHAIVPVAGSARIESVEEVAAGDFRVTAAGPSSVPANALRLALAGKPSAVRMENPGGNCDWEWSPETGTLLVRFGPASPRVKIRIAM